MSGVMAATAGGALQVVPAGEPPHLFAGEARSFPVVWQNTGSTPVTADVRMRLIQASSSTTTTLGERPWKKLQVLPGQTITERATVDFPAIKAETRFLIQWLEGTNSIFGTTEAMVYPTNLLAELKPLAGEDQSLGVFDPGNELKPLLKAAGVPFEDLEDSGIADFRGRLAVLGPFASREQMPGDMAARVEKLAPRSVGAVWFQPPPGRRAALKPTYYTVPSGTNAVVIAQGALAARLAEQPQSQLRLVQLCRLALNPEPVRLPESDRQP